MRSFVTSRRDSFGGFAVRSPWRLLIDGPAAGPWNMATDEVLLAAATAHGPPTLRLYRWDGPWLSLGYGQRLTAERVAACERAGVGIVRRVTGGSAVLHGADLTYALTAREEALPAGLVATYALVASALASALAAVGIAAEPAPWTGGHRPRAFDCFAAAAGDELCVGGRKLIGSAQRRCGGGVLQHGSIRLGPDPELARKASGLDTAAATSLRQLGCRVSAEDLGIACAEAFSACFDAPFEPAELSPEEGSGVPRRVAARTAGGPTAAPISRVASPLGLSRVHEDGR